MPPAIGGEVVVSFCGQFPLFGTPRDSEHSFERILASLRGGRSRDGGGGGRGACYVILDLSHEARGRGSCYVRILDLRSK